VQLSVRNLISALAYLAVGTLVAGLVATEVILALLPLID
jgi:hypothetical protein